MKVIYVNTIKGRNNTEVIKNAINEFDDIQNNKYWQDKKTQ